MRLCSAPDEGVGERVQTGSMASGLVVSQRTEANGHCGLAYGRRGRAGKE